VSSPWNASDSVVASIAVSVALPRGPLTKPASKQSPTSRRRTERMWVARRSSRDNGGSELVGFEQDKVHAMPLPMAQEQPRSNPSSTGGFSRRPGWPGNIVNCMKGGVP